VAERCSVSKTSVQIWCKKYFPDFIEPPGGLPEKLSAQDKRTYVRAVTSGRLDTAVVATKRLRKETGVDVSDCTVRRARNEAGLYAQEKVAKPKLSAKNIKARLDFARRHQHWTVDD
jgi:transposase